MLRGPARGANVRRVLASRLPDRHGTGSACACAFTPSAPPCGARIPLLLLVLSVFPPLVMAEVRPCGAARRIGGGLKVRVTSESSCPDEQVRGGGGGGC
jgi:hypothetical protein